MTMMAHTCRYCGEASEWCCDDCGALLCEMHARDVRLPQGQGIVIICMGQCYARALQRAGRPTEDRSPLDKRN